VKQECESIPACIICPYNYLQLVTAITILKQEYNNGKSEVKRVARVNSLVGVSLLFVVVAILPSQALLVLRVAPSLIFVILMR
jgi:hypothetical protein